MRTLKDDIIRRGNLRYRYFEDPEYRTWSSVSKDGRRFDHCRDDILFSYYLRGSTNGLLTGEEIKKLLNKGHELPINWHNFYTYFDKRANDEECGYRESILNPDYTSLDDDGWKHLSIMDILNRYRDILLKPDYDII